MTRSHPRSPTSGSSRSRRSAATSSSRTTTASSSGCPSTSGSLLPCAPPNDPDQARWRSPWRVSSPPARSRPASAPGTASTRSRSRPASAPSASSGTPRPCSPSGARRRAGAERAGRRATAGKAPALAELVDARLAEQKVAADSVTWDAWRGDDDRWVVSVAYPGPRGTGSPPGPSTRAAGCSRRPTTRPAGWATTRRERVADDRPTAIRRLSAIPAAPPTARRGPATPVPRRRALRPRGRRGAASQGRSDASAGRPSRHAARGAPRRPGLGRHHVRPPPPRLRRPSGPPSAATVRSTAPGQGRPSPPAVLTPDGVQWRVEPARLRQRRCGARYGAPACGRRRVRAASVRPGRSDRRPQRPVSG